jgi:hypothetical protein
VPLHRSILFWLGLFVLCFLLWAWAESRRHYTLWSFMPSRDHAVCLIHADSALSLKTASALDIPSSAAARDLTGIFPRSLHIPLKADQRKPWLRPLYWRSTVELGEWLDLDSGPTFFPATPPTESFFLRIPFWLIIALYIAAWLALSIWRARKIAKGLDHLQSSPHPDFES